MMMQDEFADDAFREAMQDVAPINKGRRRAQKSAQEVSLAQLRRRDAAEGKGTEEADPNYLTLSDVPLRQPLEYLEWKKDGVQNAVFSKLRHGGYPIDEQLDLHRKTVKEARAAVFQFLKVASAREWRCVCIAHGKGELSRTPGRLKSYLAAWLEQHHEVNAYCSAQRQHGGVGATYVLVKKSMASKERNREQHGQKSDLDAL